MPHIAVNNELAGIRGLLNFCPETAEPLGELANVLLRDTEGLSPAERELIATYVSYLNDCFYCHNSHGAIACIYLADGVDANFAEGMTAADAKAVVEAVCSNPESAPISDKLKALLAVAGKVQKSGKAVLPEDIERARSVGATDKDIHDTVLIAAAFCLFNRYVDGLAANTPGDLSTYEPRARQVAERGYGKHIFSLQQPVR